MPIEIAPGPGPAPDVEPDLRPVNPYAKVYANFTAHTAEHVLTVVQDDGLRRQMHVGAPGTRIWSWGVTTWPGYLATFGDVADGYMFSRNPDMIDFFDAGIRLDYYSDGAPNIDFRYWAQKLSGGRSHEMRVYSEEQFLRSVAEELAEHETLGTEAQKEFETIVEVSQRVCARNGVDYEAYLRELREPGADASVICLPLDPSDFDELELFGMLIPEQSPAQIREEILLDARRHSEDETAARNWLSSDEQVERFGSDTWEWDIRDYDTHFLFTCYAIAKSALLWRQYKTTAPRETVPGAASLGASV